MPETPPPTAAAAPPAFELIGSRHFPEWLANERISLAFTTYQTGKLFLLGLQPNGRLSVFERTFNRCLGLWGDGQTLWMSSLYQLWRFENILERGQLHDGYDRVYVPRLGYVTGDLDIHDVAVGGMLSRPTDDLFPQQSLEGPRKHGTHRVVFVNTLFGCLATVSERYNFIPLWKPPFLSKLAAEDRCHLNGLALEHGEPRYVTMVSQTDVADGWRDRRRDGGTVVDVRADAIVMTGLSMPHSPRLYRDRLWLLDSGSGFFGWIDPAHGRFEPMTFCPGYLRGLAFVGNYAVIGSSLQRENRTFSGLALDENLASRQAQPRCGLYVIDLGSGDLVHWVRIEGIVRELYDVVVLPEVRRPMALGFRTDEIQRTVSVGPPELPGALENG